ncbi:MAG: FkbM family methyltransferase [Verrucomicrobiota bacterium]
MSIRSQIEGLLAESVAAAGARERTAFGAQLRGTDGGVVLFGAGRLGRLCARALRRAGVPLRAFCDRNARLHGTTVEGAVVLSPEEAAARHGDGALFVVAIWTGAARESMAERLAWLRGLGCRSVVPYSALAWAHGTTEVPFHSFDRPSAVLAHAGEIRELAASLADEESQETLARDLERRLHGRFSPAAPAPDQYFPPFIAWRTDEVLVDAGAFDGDTLAEFLRRSDGGFRAYLAIEPDAASLEKLRGRVAGLPEPVRGKISILPVALHDRDGELAFSGGGTVESAITPRGRSTVQTRRLDGLLAGHPVTILKLDIEGAEPAALCGAAQLLATQQPLVAACCYHLPDDLWVVPRMLRQHLPNHRVYMRCHGYDGWETVCYAVPAERVVRS